MRFGTAINSAGDEVSVLLDGGALYALPDADGGLGMLLAGDPRGVHGRALAARDAPPLDGARLTAPLMPRKIVAVGLNYLDHIREASMEQPERPLLFSKFPSAVIGPGEPIEVDRSVCERADWEVELAVVIGRRMRRVSRSEALDGVFGYTVANDVSARDVQFSDGQWTRGKSLDTFCPLGPSIVTPDEVGDPQALALRTKVNGELMQDSSTSEMVFGVAELIEFCSESFTLEPGDVILTGTPWGCGEFMHPPRSLEDGDVVEVHVERVGTLSNPVSAVSR